MNLDDLQASEATDDFEIFVPSALHWMDLLALKAVVPEQSPHFYFSGATSLPYASALATTRIVSALFAGGALPGTGHHVDVDERRRGGDINILESLLQENVVAQGPGRSWALTEKALDALVPSKIATATPYSIMRPRRRDPDGWKDATMYEIIYALLQDNWLMEEVPLRGWGGDNRLMRLARTRSCILGSSVLLSLDSIAFHY